MLLFVKITKETINLVIKENYLLFIKIDRKDREGISWITKLQLSDSLHETVLNDLWINLQFIRLVFVDSKKEISVTFDTVTWGKKSCWSDTLLIISKIGLSFQADVKIVACMHWYSVMNLATTCTTNRPQKLYNLWKGY